MVFRVQIGDAVYYFNREEYYKFLDHLPINIEPTDIESSEFWTADRAINDLMED